MADRKESEREVVNKKAISELVNTWGAAMLCKYCHEDGKISFVLLYDDTDFSTTKAQQSIPILQKLCFYNFHAPTSPTSPIYKTYQITSLFFTRIVNILKRILN